MRCIAASGPLTNGAKSASTKGAEREREPALQREREVLHVRDRVGGPRAVRGRREQEGPECGACPFLRTFAAVGRVAHVCVSL